MTSIIINSPLIGWVGLEERDRFLEHDYRGVYTELGTDYNFAVLLSLFEAPDNWDRRGIIFQWKKGKPANGETVERIITQLIMENARLYHKN